MKKIETILQYLENQGIPISKFERECGLGNGYFAGVQERDADITVKMLDRIREKSKEHYEKMFGPAADKDDRPVLKEPLEVTIRLMAEDKLRSTAIIERLVTILEKRLNSETQKKETVPPVEPGTTVAPAHRGQHLGKKKKTD